jgi:hypothetical protein
MYHQLQWVANASASIFRRASRRFEFKKRSQLFISAHDETLSVTAMRVNNPDRLPVAIHG